MKLLNRAFTLGEVLIVIAIVGVITALTGPALVNNVSDRVNSANLSRATNIVETAMQSMFQAASSNTQNDVSNQVYSLSVLKESDLFGEQEDFVVDEEGNPTEEIHDPFLLDDGILFSLTRSFTKFDTRENAYLANVVDFSGNLYTTTDANFDGYEVYQLPKQKTFIIYQAPDEDAVNSDNITSNTIISKIYIDANGEDGPNRIGKDIFLFGLADSGNLIPAGSQRYNDGIEAIFSEETIDLYDDETEGANNCLDGSITDGLSCAARVVAEGWRINY